MVCGGCHLPCTPEDSKPRSSRSHVRFHIICNNAYKVHQKRWAKEPALKRAWQDKTPEEVVEWYQKRYHDGRGQRGVKRQIAVEHEESDERGKYIDFLKKVVYEPYDVFQERYMAMGKSDAWIENKWREQLNDSTIPRKKMNGMTMVGRFTGR